MAVDRLSFLDESFLALDCEDAPLHVAFMIRLDGTPPAVGAFRRHLDGRMHRVPRFRRRLARTTMIGGDLRWVDDQAFDIANHVTAVSATAPGDTNALRALAQRLVSDPLPRDRPLWRIYIVTGLKHGWALVGQAHHALVDGAAALQVAALLFDVEPNPAADAITGWSPHEPAPASSAATMARDRARRTAREAESLLRGGASIAARTATSLPARRGAELATASGLAQAAQVAHDLVREAPAMPLARNTTAQRALGWAQMDVATVKNVAREADATVNDVLLTCVGRAISHALERRDETPIPIKAMVPVNVRTGHSDGAANAISSLVVDIPADHADLAEGLRVVAARTRTLKAEQRAAPLTSVARVADALPSAAGRSVARFVGSLAKYHVAISNVPGPTVPLYVLGREVRGVYPGVPMLHGHGLTVGVVSYCGVLNVGVFADAEVVPDAQAIADDVAAALRVMQASEPRTVQRGRFRRDSGETPWGSRAHARRTTARD